MTGAVKNHILYTVKNKIYRKLLSLCDLKFPECCYMVTYISVLLLLYGICLLRTFFFREVFFPSAISKERKKESLLSLCHFFFRD
jgi:hypothetical protein